MLISWTKMAESKQQSNDSVIDQTPTKRLNRITAKSGSVPETLRRGDWSKRIETKECVICAEERPIYRNFPSFEVCSHEPLVCSTCITTQTVHRLEQYRHSTNREVCVCLLCDASIPQDQFQNVLQRALVKEMNESFTQAKFAGRENFRWYDRCH